MRTSPEIRVLGPLEVVREDASLAPLAPRERRLLGALVVERGKTCSSDVLVDAVWGTSPPPSSAKLLQVYVSKLRKALPACARIRTVRSGYELDVEEGAVDSARFERLLSEGREAAAAGNSALAAAILDRALALWRGSAYGELAYEEFARAEAERLEELRLVALEERIEAELESGRDVLLLAEVLSLASAHPLRERFQAQAMLALYRSGRQSEALDRYAATRRRLREELGLEPGPALRDLQRRILRHDATLTPGAGAQEVARSSVPAAPNRLLGRERELAELEELLRRDDVRLLVLTGAGGSGKTRLALEAARRSARFFAHRAAFVELAPVGDPELLVAAIADALGSEQIGSRPLETLVPELRARELLLVLDNLEHLREATPALVELVAQAPRLTLLVTSRVVLHLSGEHVYPVEPLREPAAVELFLVRAREADARFRPAPADEATIRRICERLDGLPLAIELAAGRIRTRTLQELLAGLERRLPLLTGGPRDLPARQRTLRATLEWSFDLLTKLERRDLSRLSVFAGGCTLETAEAVCGTTLDRLSALVDHNLVVRNVGAHGSRYSLLETVRELASEHLERSGEADSVRRRHAEHMLAIARAAHLSEDDDEPFEQAIALEEREDLRAALDWAAEADVLLGLELAVALENFWSSHAPAEGVRRIGGLLGRDAAPPPRLRARALRVLAGSAHQERDFDLADPCYEESLGLFTELGDTRGTAPVRTRLAYRAAGKGDPELARRLVEDSRREASDRFPLIEAQNILLLAQLAVADGRLEEAESLIHQGRGVAAGLRWAWWESNTLNMLLEVALRRGDLEEAERHGRTALAIDVDHEHVLAAVHDLAGLARIALARGDLERAGVLWGAVRERGEGRWGKVSGRWAAELDAERRPEFLTALARGRGLELWDAAAIALAGETAPVGAVHA